MDNNNTDDVTNLEKNQCCLNDTNNDCCQWGKNENVSVKDSQEDDDNKEENDESQEDEEDEENEEDEDSQEKSQEDGEVDDELTMVETDAAEKQTYDNENDSSDEEDVEKNNVPEENKQELNEKQEVSDQGKKLTEVLSDELLKNKDCPEARKLLSKLKEFAGMAEDMFKNNTSNKTVDQNSKEDN